jgi:hypothetical protein
VNIFTPIFGHSSSTPKITAPDETIPTIKTLGDSLSTKITTKD